MYTRFLSVLACFGAKRQHSSLLDAPEGQLQHRARSTKKLRPQLTTPAAILAHFHPLLWLAEALHFNTLICSAKPLACTVVFKCFNRR